jgi:hypothetical protein
MPLRRALVSKIAVAQFLMVFEAVANHVLVARMLIPVCLGIIALTGVQP